MLRSWRDWKWFTNNKAREDSSDEDSWASSRVSDALDTTRMEQDSPPLCSTQSAVFMSVPMVARQSSLKRSRSGNRSTAMPAIPEHVELGGGQAAGSSADSPLRSKLHALSAIHMQRKHALASTEREERQDGGLFAKH